MNGCNQDIFCAKIDDDLIAKMINFIDGGNLISIPEKQLSCQEI